VLQTLEGHSDSVNSVAFSPDGKQVVSGSSDRTDRTVQLWDATTGATLQTLEGHPSYIRSVAFSPDGQALNTLLVSKSWIAEGGTNILATSHKLVHYSSHKADNDFLVLL
jgi:WD40 repeat protein